MRRHWITMLIGVTGLASLAVSAPLSQTDIQDLFSQGKDLFRQANARAATDAAGARTLYGDAALHFERIVREGNVRSGPLYYDIGNAYFRMNDLGRAILNYRRAALYTPNDPNLIQNLRYARARRMDRIEEPQQTRILQTLFFWHYDLPVATRSEVFAVSFVLFWILAGVRLFWRRPALAWGAAIAAIVALLMLGSVAIEGVELRLRRPGVVLSDEVVARKGDSATYDPSFKDPLHAGTELTLVERRSDWSQVQLIDGRRCWLPNDAFELVR